MSPFNRSDDAYRFPRERCHLCGALLLPEQAATFIVTHPDGHKDSWKLCNVRPLFPGKLEIRDDYDMETGEPVAFYIQAGKTCAEQVAAQEHIDSWRVP